MNNGQRYIYKVNLDYNLNGDFSNIIDTQEYRRDPGEPFAPMELQYHPQTVAFCRTQDAAMICAALNEYRKRRAPVMVDPTDGYDEDDIRIGGER